jgi:hypothetical protein
MTDPIRRWVAGAIVGLVAAGGVAVMVTRRGPEPTPATGVPGTPFSNGGTWIYHYVHRPEPPTYGATRYTDITERIEGGFYTSRGITNLMIYAPYRSTGEFRGLPAIDFKDVSPENGTVDDFRAMVSAANGKGITVTMYIALIYISPLNPIFVKAQQDRRDDIDSTERRVLRWDDRIPGGSVPPPDGAPPDEAEVARPLEGAWAWSEIAHRWYAMSWGFPAIDFANESTREYAKGVLRFWMDLGVQGFEFDAPPSYWGMQGADDARQTEVMITTPREHRPDLELYLHAEGFGTYDNEAYSDRIGFTHIMINGDDDNDSFATRAGRVPPTGTVDQLEQQWARYADPRRQAGRGVYAVSLYDVDLDPRLRALDAAVQAGMGAQYAIDYEELVENSNGPILAPATVEGVWDVFRTLRRSPALSPSASRERLPTGDDPHAYAIKRTSLDGSRTALLVYTFSNEEAAIGVDLAGRGITVPQRATDLAAGEPGPALDTTAPTFILEPYGYRFLDVQASDRPRMDP